MLDLKALLIKILVKLGNIDAGTGGHSVSVSASSYSDLNITFNVTFKSVPIVVVGFNTTSTAGGFGRCSCAVLNVTTTGCTVRVFNGDTTTREPAIRWIAIAP